MLVARVVGALAVVCRRYSQVFLVETCSHRFLDHKVRQECVEARHPTTSRPESRTWNKRRCCTHFRRQRKNTPVRFIPMVNPLQVPLNPVVLFV